MEKARKREQKRLHKPKKATKKAYPKGPKAKAKIKKIFREAKAGKLRSGSKTGPKVTSQDQILAIALSEARKASKRPSRKKQARKTSKK